MRITSMASARRALPMAALAGLVLAGCSSSSNTASTTTTTSASGSSGSSTASQLRSLSSAVQNAEHASFKAVYTATNNGQTQTVTFEQAPPKSYFASSDGSVIDTGSTTYFCSTSSGQQTCISTSGGQNPLAGLLQLFSPATAVTALQQAETEVAAHVAGVDVSFSSQTFAGQDSTCVTVNASGQSGKYCVAKSSGILTYEGTGSNSFELTSFSSSVTDSDFAPPAGATIETIPSGITPST